MTPAAWAALGMGGVAIGLAIALVVAITGKVKVERARDKLEARCNELALELGSVVTELAEVRGRTSRQISDLIADVQVCEARYLNNATDDEVLEAFRIALRRDQ